MRDFHFLGRLVIARKNLKLEKVAFKSIVIGDKVLKIGNAEKHYHYYNVPVEYVGITTYKNEKYLAFFLSHTNLIKEHKCYVLYKIYNDKLICESDYQLETLESIFETNQYTINF